MPYNSVPELRPINPQIPQPLMYLDQLRNQQTQLGMAKRKLDLEENRYTLDVAQEKRAQSSAILDAEKKQLDIDKATQEKLLKQTEIFSNAVSMLDPEDPKSQDAWLGLRNSVIKDNPNLADVLPEKFDEKVQNRVVSGAKYIESKLKGTEKDDIITINGIAYQIYTDKDGKKSLTQIGGEEKPKNKEQLTIAALSGDAEAKQLLDKMNQLEVEMAGKKGEESAAGKLRGLETAIDLPGTARAILEGRETIENVRNTFGVPIQERVRKEVLKEDPNFNFNQPRAQASSLKASLTQQQKNRGMMGSFVKNINGQVDRLENISQNIVKRIGVRALDLPRRELLTRVIGSGHEQVMAAYMKEISAEIAKLSQGSAASIAQLPEENRREWEKIHDVNLSMRELLIILNGTREMANIRLQSVQDEINYTMDKLNNVRTTREPREKPQEEANTGDFEIIEVK